MSSGNLIPLLLFHFMFDPYNLLESLYILEFHRIFKKQLAFIQKPKLKCIGAISEVQNHSEIASL